MSDKNTETQTDPGTTEQQTVVQKPKSVEQQRSSDEGQNEVKELKAQLAELQGQLENSKAQDLEFWQNKAKTLTGKVDSLSEKLKRLEGYRDIVTADVTSQIEALDDDAKEYLKGLQSVKDQHAALKVFQKVLGKSSETSETTPTLKNLHQQKGSELDPYQAALAKLEKQNGGYVSYEDRYALAAKYTKKS